MRGKAAAVVGDEGDQLGEPLRHLDDAAIADVAAEAVVGGRLQEGEEAFAPAAAPVAGAVKEGLVAFP